jgi:hypothetical protein
MRFGRAAALAAFALVVACDTGGVARHSPSPVTTTPVAAASPSPDTTTPLAVYDGPTLDGSGHTVYVVGIGKYGRPQCEPKCRVLWANETAKLLFTATGGARNPPPGFATRKATDLPYVSTSKTRIYFLDGDATVRAIARDGTVTQVASIPGSAAVHAAFAVSPRDDQIAVGLIDYSQQPITETAYVANLDGSGRVDLFTSTGSYYWPVGWHAGQVVLALGPAISDGSIPHNQYSATGYALVATTAGARPAPLGLGDCLPTGSVTPAGSACLHKPGTKCLGTLIGTNGSVSYYSSCFRRLGWDGKETNFGLTGSWETQFAINHAALSTDGRVIMGEQLFWVVEPGPAGYPGLQAGYGGLTIFNQLPEQPGMGWIDPLHFSMMFVNTYEGTTYQRIYSLSDDYTRVYNVYFQGAQVNDSVAYSDVFGQLIGTVPGGL